MAVAVLGVAGYFAWGAFAKRMSAPTAHIPTVAAACPQQDDMLALEGYAPGAGGTEHLGQTGLGQLGSIAGGAAGATSAPTAVPSLNCRALAADVEETFRAIDQAAQVLPRDGYDEAARGTTLGNPDAIFAFVRDQVRTEAYAGAMRGGVGTLMNRSGSPADKTLLLAELLGTQGVGVRFVHATLADADVAQVIGTILEAPAPTKASTSSQLPADAAQLFTDDTNAARTIADQIVASLTSAGVTFASSDAAVRAKWSANLRDHWWLQAQEGGTWVDLDPTLSHAPAGSHLGPAPSADPADQLPTALYTTIDVRIIGDFVDQARATPKTLSEKQVRAADAYAQPIVVQLGDPDATVSNLASSRAFVASISAGGSTTSGDPFQPDPGTGAHLLRLRLEIETDRPGYPPLIERRTIVDRGVAGGTSVDASWTAKRTAYALTTTYDGLALSGELDPAFAAAREVEATHAAHALLVYAINRQLDALPQDADQTYPIEVMHYVELDGMVRHATEAQSANRTRFYFDRPVIAFVRHALLLKGTNVVAQNDFDVVDSAMDVTGTKVAAAVRDNVVRGVVADAIEANVSFPKASVTTRTLFAAANRSGVPTVAVLPSTSPPPLPPAAVAAATASLQRGAILAIARPVSLGAQEHVGWWEVDPATGSTVGRLESGAGQALSEYLPTTGVALKANTIANVVGGFDACMFADVNQALATSNGNGLDMASGCGQQVACDFFEGQAVGLFADFLYGSDLVNQLTDLDNQILQLGAKMCG